MKSLHVKPVLQIIQVDPLIVPQLGPGWVLFFFVQRLVLVRLLDGNAQQQQQQELNIALNPS